MKVLLLLLIIVGMIIGGVTPCSFGEEGSGQSVVEENEATDVDLAEETDDVEHGFIDPNKTKMEKVSDSISTFPEKTGNIFLDGFNRFGNWLEEKSGNRFETRWDSQENDDSRRASSGMRSFERDPAMGS